MTTPTKEQCVQWARECGVELNSDYVTFSLDEIHAFALKVLAESEDRTNALVSLLEEARNDCEQVLHSYLPHAGYERYDRLIAYQKDLIARIDAAIEAEKVRTE